MRKPKIFIPNYRYLYIYKKTISGFLTCTVLSIFNRFVQNSFFSNM